MHTKIITTFSTITKIGIELEELKQCTEIGTFSLLDCSPVRKTNVFENTDLYRTNWRKRYFNALSCYPTRNMLIWKTGEHYNHKLLMIFQQCKTMGSCLLNFLIVA